MANHIDGFLHEGQSYSHTIFSDEDDRVELRDADGNVVLTYTANCYVLDKDKKQIGEFHMRDHNWFFRPENGASMTYGRNLLKAEIEVSKAYLKGEIKHG